MAGLHVNAASDDFSGASLDTSKWQTFIPHQVDGANDASVTQTDGHIVIHDRGYLETTAGYTPSAATPLHISFSWTFSGSADYLVVTDGTNGPSNDSLASEQNGISFVGNWQIGDPGAMLIQDHDGHQVRVGTSLVQGNTYDVSITDDGSHQTFVITDDATGQVVGTASSDFTNDQAGNLVTFTNREGQDSGHDDTIDNLTVSNAYTGNAGSAIALTGFTGLTDTDGSETLSLSLSNFPTDTTFSAGHLDPGTGNWVISAGDIAALNGAPLTMTPPSTFGGTFNLHVDATVTDTATLPGGPVSDIKTFSNDVAVAVDKLTATDDAITDQPTFTENSDTTIATSVLLANDTDSLGNPITITSVGDIDHHSANGGTVTLNGNVITYTPATDFSGQDSFTYTISEGTQTSTATVTFDVAAPAATGTTDEIWTAGVDGDWNDGGNWNQNRAPVASDNVYINDPVTVSDDLGDSDQSITQLHLMSSGAELDIISSTDAHSFIISGDETSATALQNAGLIDVDTFESDGAAVSMTVSGNVENSGTIQSDGPDATVTFGAVTVDNASGTISSLDGGTVVFDGTTVSGGEISGDSSSTIEVGDGSFSAGVALTLQDGATVVDEIMTIGSGDTLQIEYGSNGPGATLDDVSVTNYGTVQVDSAIDHPPQTILTLDDGTTITGGTLSIGSVGTVDVEVGQEGSGGTNGHDFDAQLDDVTVINSGTINVDLQDGGAVLNLADGTTITGGTLDIENSGEVYVQSGSNGDVTLDNVTVTNNGEGIEIGTFVAQGSTLVLDDGTTITGGTLTLEDTADVLNVVVGPSGPGGANGPGPDATLDGVAVTNYGTIEIGSGATLALDGGGSIALQNSQIVENGPGAELELLNGTISGVGTVGDGNLTLLSDAGTDRLIKAARSKPTAARSRSTRCPSPITVRWSPRTTASCKSTASPT